MSQVSSKVFDGCTGAMGKPKASYLKIQNKDGDHKYNNSVCLKMKIEIIQLNEHYNDSDTVQLIYVYNNECIDIQEFQHSL